MEIKTFKDLWDYDNTVVYCVNNSIQYKDYSGMPYINHGVNQCKLHNIAYDRSEHPYIYTYRIINLLYNKYGGDLYNDKDIYDTISIKEGEELVDEGLHIFTTYKEADKFILKQAKLANPQIKELEKEIEKNTVTKKQIAEHFNIPIDKLRIV